MQYSQVTLANISLGRVGAKNTISSMTENSPNAVRVNQVWNSVFQEVLCERDWKFAKTRAELVLSTTKPLYGYRHAWALPVDFLRFVRPHRKPPNRMLWYFGWGAEGEGWYHRQDPPLAPLGFPYVVEMLPGGTDATKYVFIDYYSTEHPVMINYIQLISDYSRLMPGFVNCFCWRLSQEISIPITEDMKKFEMCEMKYKESLNSAEAQNETYDYLENEQGSESWVTAGRWWCVP